MNGIQRSVNVITYLIHKYNKPLTKLVKLIITMYYNSIIYYIFIEIFIHF